MSATLLRGDILHFLNRSPPEYGWEYIVDGGLLIEQGRVAFCGAWQDARARAHDDVAVHDHAGKLILPGFVDLHVHYVQTDVIAAPGHQLLDWLERYTFPEEARFDDPDWAREVAEFFCDELLRCSKSPASADCGWPPARS